MCWRVWVCACCWYCRVCKQEYCWLWTKRRFTWGWATRAQTTLLPLSRHPPPNPTCPLLLSPPSPPPPQPVPAPLLHSQPLTCTLFSLSFLPCAIPPSLSLSLHSPKVARSLLSFSCPVCIPPPLFLSLPPRRPARVCSHSPPQVERISAHRFPKLPPAKDFIFILDLFWVPQHFTTVDAGWCVLGLWCCAPGDVSVSFDWREERRRVFFDTMKVQLLLLSALVGLLCAFTSASKWTLSYHHPTVSTLCPLSLPLPPCALTTLLFVCFNPCRLNNNTLQAGFIRGEMVQVSFVFINKLMRLFVYTQIHKC